MLETTNLNKKISVILVNFNGFADTVECIQSIQKSAIPVQVVVVDNASLENEASKISALFPDVKVFRQENNLGFAGGNNIGIQWAIDQKFDYITLLNNDTIIDSNLFLHLLKNTNQNTISAPFMYYYSIPKELWYSGGIINRWTGNPKHFHTQQKTQKRITFITGCCLFLHRNIFERIGLLDESYFMYHEDTDFCLKAIKNNIELTVIPEAKIWHKVGKSSGGDESAFCIYYMTRNRLHCLKKHKSYFAKTAYAFSLLSRFVRMSILLLKGKHEWQAFLHGIRDFHKGIMGKTF